MISALVVAAIMLVAASLEASAHSLRRDADALTEIALDSGSRRAFAHSRPAAPTRPAEPRQPWVARKGRIIPPNLLCS
jgi:hypothetical protein